MTRSIASQDLVSLPNLTADESVALGTALIARRAREPALHATDDAAEELQLGVNGLSEQLLAARRKPAVDPDVARGIDLRLDIGWSAMRDWLTGWTRAAKCPAKEQVVALHHAVFGEGLDWLNARYAAEWSGSQTRLVVITGSDGAPGYETLIRETLGGGPFLDELREAHAAYTEMVILQAPEALAANPKVGEAMSELHAAMREYVTAVIGTVRRRSPATATKAAALLLPLTSWESKRPSTAASKENATG